MSQTGKEVPKSSAHASIEGMKQMLDFFSFLP